MDSLKDILKDYNGCCVEYINSIKDMIWRKENEIRKIKLDVFAEGRRIYEGPYLYAVIDLNGIIENLEQKILKCINGDCEYSKRFYTTWSKPKLIIPSVYQIKKYSFGGNLNEVLETLNHYLINDITNIIAKYLEKELILDTEKEYKRYLHWEYPGYSYYKIKMNGWLFEINNKNGRIIEITARCNGHKAEFKELSMNPLVLYLGRRPTFCYKISEGDALSDDPEVNRVEHDNSISITYNNIVSIYKASEVFRILKNTEYGEIVGMVDDIIYFYREIGWEFNRFDKFLLQYKKLSDRNY